MGRKRKRESRQLTDTHSSSCTSPARKKVRWGDERYSSSHHILLVGEGDFSFALSIANTLGSATNIVATSMDSQDVVQAKFRRAKENLNALRKMGAKILHDVDATAMDHDEDLKIRRFDRIVFNFPHAGFIGKEDQIEMIHLHRQLVFGFFKTSANMIKSHGEIHVSHKTGVPYDDWKLEELALRCSLQLIECSDFRSSDYPGYENKRGAGKSPDLPFRLGSCSTFKFKIYDAREKLDRLRKSSIPGGSAGADQFVAIPTDYNTSIEQNYTERGVGDSSLFNSPRMVRTRDYGFSNGGIIRYANQFFAMRRAYCYWLWIEQIRLHSGGNMSSSGMIFPGAPAGERNGYFDRM